MNLSFILLQAASDGPLRFFSDYTHSAALRWAVGIAAFLVVRSVFLWALGITRISHYQRENNALLNQQNQLLQRQIELLEQFGGKR